MFGNELTDVQRQSSLFNSILGASLVASPFVPALVKNGKLVKEETINQMHKLATNTKSGARYVYDEVRGGMQVLFGNQNMNFAYAVADGVKPILSNVMNSKEVSKRIEEVTSRFSFRKNLGGSKGSEDSVGIITKGTGKDVQIPSVRNNEFNMWFDKLSVDEFEEMWNVPQLRSKIEDRIRRPGGYHEWHLVARTPKFKQWGISMDDIKEMRSLTKDVEFVNPPGRHGSRGSTKAHNEILKIIDSAPDYENFVRRLNDWASNRMKNGVMDLPEGLRR